MTKGRGKRALLSALCVFGLMLFTGLGVWQVERRGWKLNLIARVNARIYAPPALLPSPASWPRLQPSEIEYRRVRVAGTFLNERETLVDALTERGPGWWLVTPLRTASGIVLVNRGFVPPDRKEARSRPDSQVAGVTIVTGLLRLSEPDGRVLRPNDPPRDRWFSRDVAAIASTRGLAKVAPFFIDADSTPNPGGVPLGGLTVVQFRNAHLAYALTWFALAALCIAGLVLLLLRSQHLR